jgi:hypothetical protein
LFWWSPSPTDAVSAEYLTDASRYVDEFAAGAPDFIVLRPAPSWDPENFGSVTHLTPTAAKSNSEELAKYIHLNLN